MIRARHLLIAALSLSLLALSGCKRLFGDADCSKPAAYADSRNLPPLRIPVGLDGPDTRAAMKIPELNEPEIPRKPGDACLDEPPAYSTSAPAAR
jgi:hypothetical protein